MGVWGILWAHVLLLHLLGAAAANHNRFGLGGAYHLISLQMQHQNRCPNRAEIQATGVSNKSRHREQGRCWIARDYGRQGSSGRGGKDHNPVPRRRPMAIASSTSLFQLPALACAIASPKKPCPARRVKKGLAPRSAATLSGTGRISSALAEKPWIWITPSGVFTPASPAQAILLVGDILMFEVCKSY
jgi:hypothetical protein